MADTAIEKFKINFEENCSRALRLSNDDLGGFVSASMRVVGMQLSVMLPELQQKLVSIGYGHRESAVFLALLLAVSAPAGTLAKIIDQSQIDLIIADTKITTAMDKLVGKTD